MNKVTIVKNENYTTVSNIPLQSKELSWKAKGLLMYLLTLPSSWEVRLSDLENRSTDGRDSTNGAIQELMKHRYISRVPIEEKGKFLGYDYTVSDEPNQPASEKPQRFIRNGSPATENPSLLSTKEEVLKKEEEPHISPKAIATHILDYLNQKAGKGFKPIDTHLKLIQARLKDGFTVEECKRVVDSRVAKWLNNPKMREYLRPSTLFTPSNFDSYLNDYTQPKLSGVNHDPSKPAYEERAM